MRLHLNLVWAEALRVWFQGELNSLERKCSNFDEGPLATAYFLHALRVRTFDFGRIPTAQPLLDPLLQFTRSNLLECRSTLQEKLVASQLLNPPALQSAKQSVVGFHMGENQHVVPLELIQY